ncbi:hypothetical protein [Pricia sp.]|uniref:hypothetical protein n=1 Tax=Pricia sp. TaxID=2268138 RepID=UPI003594542D
MYPLIIIFSLQIAIAQKAPNDYVTEIVDVQFKKLGATEIEGAITFKNGYVDETTVYFRSRFNKAFKSVDGWQSAAYTGETTNYGV